MVKYIVTKDALVKLLENEARRPLVVGRALVCLFNRQTNDEKIVNSTKVVNQRGFTQADGRSGSLTAKAFLKNQSLAPWQVDRWMRLESSGYPRICKYWRQLNEEAVEKAARRQALSQI